VSQAIIGVLGTGDMGSAVGAMFRGSGYRVVTDLTGRSQASRALAADAGLEDLGSLEAVMGTADVFLSILPPAAAYDFAVRATAAIRAAGRAPVFADCNAVAPATVGAIEALVAGSGARFVDVGIVGPAPRAGTSAPTRFYVSGGARRAVLDLAAPEITMIDMGEDIGRASAIKMAYASLNKGVDALYTAILLAAERLGVRRELMAELEASQAEAARRMAGRVPFLAATAARFTGEMREIAATFESVHVTGDFHRGAEWVYATLAASTLASETRATLPAERSLDEAVAAFAAVLPAAHSPASAR